MKKSNSKDKPGYVKDGTLELVMTSSGWFGFTRHYATSDSPIVHVSRDREEALEEIYRLELEDKHETAPVVTQAKWTTNSARTLKTLSGRSGFCE